MLQSGFSSIIILQNVSAVGTEIDPAFSRVLFKIVDNDGYGSALLQMMIDALNG